MRSFRLLVFLLFLFVSAQADGVRVGTLNCYLFFNPAVSRPGNLPLGRPLTAQQYDEKLHNLTTLISDCGFLGLQEIGGKTEVEDFAKATGWEWAFTPGKDTYTGEEVGAVYHLPGWKVTNAGRVSDLDKILSKHLLVTATKDNKTLKFLVVHLIRPIGKNEEKHAKQVSAISAWATAAAAGNVTVIVLGDTNDTHVVPGASIFGTAKEANELLAWQATHVIGKPYDRLALFGPGTWSDAAIARPAYGKKPNDLQRTLWTDHFALKATLNY